MLSVMCDVSGKSLQQKPRKRHTVRQVKPPLFYTDLYQPYIINNPNIPSAKCEVCGKSLKQMERYRRKCSIPAEKSMLYFYRTLPLTLFIAQAHKV